MVRCAKQEAWWTLSVQKYEVFSSPPNFYHKKPPSSFLPFCVPILQGRAPGFMHPDAAPAPDARRAKKPPIHSGWWGMLRLRRAKRRIERTEKQDTKDWRRTYLTGRTECLLRYLIPAFVINMTVCYRGCGNNVITGRSNIYASCSDVGSMRTSSCRMDF